MSQTNRGKPALIVDDFLYRLKTTTKSTRIWQCSAKKDCTAKITTGSDSLDILHGCTIHSHERDVKKIQTHTLRQACKRRAAEDTCERPRKILVSEARRDETSIRRVDDRDMGNIRRAMWFERRKVLPKVCTVLPEFVCSKNGDNSEEKKLPEIAYTKNKCCRKTKAPLGAWVLMSKRSTSRIDRYI